MKLRYSELAANPAYYSFGYAIYGTPEPGDTLAFCYEQGFLPCVIAKEQDPRLMYRARGTRVRLAGFSRKHYHARVVRKVEDAFPEGIDVTLHTKDALPNPDAVRTFFSTYFAFKFGKDAMPEERLRAIFDSPYVSHIAEYRYQGETIAYSLEVHGEDFVHVWHQAYLKKYQDRHLGIYLYIELAERAKAKEKEFLYFGVTYGAWMRYKTNFEPLEYFDGNEWVNDPKSKALKDLFSRDASRLVAYVDEWRSSHDPYYPAPFPYRSRFDVVRGFGVFAALFPKTTGLILLCLGLLLLLSYLVSTF